MSAAEASNPRLYELLLHESNHLALVPAPVDGVLTDVVVLCVAKYFVRNDDNLCAGCNVIAHQTSDPNCSQTLVSMCIFIAGKKNDNIFLNFHPDSFHFLFF